MRLFFCLCVFTLLAACTERGHLSDVKSKSVNSRADIGKNKGQDRAHMPSTENLYALHGKAPIEIPFSSENIGIYKKLEKTSIKEKKVSKQDIIDTLGIHQTNNNKTIIFRNKKTKKIAGGLTIKSGYFKSYDVVRIPFIEIRPRGFDKQDRYPTVILFSGHGTMEDVAFEKRSYQRGMGLKLAKQGFLVFTMENRGMGSLAYLGEHLRIDAVARMVGESWYGNIISDALVFTSMVAQRNYVREIGVGGISSGGAISLFTSALDDRIKSTYVQGYLGSFTKTFGTKGQHCMCNNIANVANKFDLVDVAEKILPRSALYVNGDKDTFDAQDASEAFVKLSQTDAFKNHKNRASFVVPKNTGHVVAESVMLKYFRKQHF